MCVYIYICVCLCVCLQVFWIMTEKKNVLFIFCAYFLVKRELI